MVAWFVAGSWQLQALLLHAACCVLPVAGSSKLCWCILHIALCLLLVCGVCHVLSAVCWCVVCACAEQARYHLMSKSTLEPWKHTKYLMVSR